MWTTVPALAIALALFCSPALAGGVHPGAHSAQPKYWTRSGHWVTNFSPLDFGGPILGLTPGTSGGVWFGVGNTLQHIDASNRMTMYRMPDPLWLVESVTRGPNNSIWFSAGQSGRLGILDARGTLRFETLVARRNFPDIHGLAVSRSGEVWFVDTGRLSFGHRSLAGIVAEYPAPKDQYPQSVVRCNDLTWAAAGGILGTLSADAQVHRFALPIREDGQISGMACSGGVLWFTFTPGYYADKKHETPPPFLGFITPDRRLHFIPTAAVNAGKVVEDAAGGVWVETSRLAQFAQADLLHVQSDGIARTVHLPPGIYLGSMAADEDGTLWLGVDNNNAPAAVTRLTAAKP